jgi:hypothetical protein
MRWGVAQLEHEVDTYKADSSAQQKSISELEQQKRQLADDLQVHPPSLPHAALPTQSSRTPRHDRPRSVLLHTTDLIGTSPRFLSSVYTSCTVLGLIFFLLLFRENETLSDVCCRRSR